MADKFVINGGKSLSGEIEVRGSKNAAGPALVATLLTQEECIIDNVPFIDDISNILDTLKDMGAEVEKTGEEGQMDVNLIPGVVEKEAKDGHGVPSSRRGKAGIQRRERRGQCR